MRDFLNIKKKSMQFYGKIYENKIMKNENFNTKVNKNKNHNDNLIGHVVIPFT